MNTKPRLLRITTVPISLKILLHGQLSYFKQQGFEVLTISAGGSEVQSLRDEGIPHHAVEMTRKITPLKDLVSLMKLIGAIRKFRPDIVHTHTPKAGLLGMMAAWICRVPIRLHTIAGLPLMEATGIKRKLLLATERLTYACASKIYPNAEGLKQYIKDHIPTKTPISIIGKGSSNGINTAVFSRTVALEESAQSIRDQYNIHAEDVVFSFVGRIVKDKGVSEIITAFKGFYRFDQESGLSGMRKIFLMLIGPFEQELDPLIAEDYDFLHQHPQVILAGFQSDVRPWMMASDVFLFPSYREGFPNVVMQACCLKVPCIVSDINGCNEIIKSGDNGLIVPVKNAAALEEAMKVLANDSAGRKIFAERARDYVVKNFDQLYVWRALHDEYTNLLNTPLNH